MDVFITGGTGYIGSIIVEKLRERGHAVTGLARSDETARKLAALGANICRGELQDKAVLSEAARRSDAVIHAGMTRGPDRGVIDRNAVEAMLDALVGTDKPFVYTSGSAVMGSTGDRPAGEWFSSTPPEFVKWRPAVERLVLDAAERKVRGLVIRPTMVFGRGGGIVAALQKGHLPMVGDGENRWTFVHVDDLAGLYVLAVERGSAGQIYLAADGQAVKAKDICAAAGVTRRVSLEEARREIGPFAELLVLDQRILSTKAGRELGWIASRPSVLDDLRKS